MGCASRRAGSADAFVCGPSSSGDARLRVHLATLLQRRAVGTLCGVDMVLPVARRDARRAHLCVQSFAARFSGIGSLWLIAPDNDLDQFAWVTAYPFVRLLADSAVVGNRSLLHRCTAIADARYPGWYRQQRIKLGAARLVQGEFYLTLDADVLLTQPLHETALLDGPRALCVRHELCHPTWYRVASQLLSLPRLHHEYGVTPVLLHKQSVLALLAHLDERGRDLGRWLGWTEYALFFTFLEGRGSFDALYRPIAFDAWFGPCAWSPWSERDGSWSTELAFARRDAGWFSILSSRCDVPVARLEQLLAPHLYW